MHERIDEQIPEPIPIVNPTAWMIAMSENTMPTAPDALVPSFETKKVSAMRSRSALFYVTAAPAVVPASGNPIHRPSLRQAARDRPGKIDQQEDGDPHQLQADDVPG